MLHFNARNSKGFTLIELLVVMIMIGILSAISAPSFLGLLNRNRINNATIRLKSALVEAQANSTRVGKSCTLNISPNAGTSTTLVDSSAAIARAAAIAAGATAAAAAAAAAAAGQCWRTGADSFADTNVSLRIVDTVNPSTNPTPNSLPITFDFKGRVTTAIPATSIDYGTGGSDTRKIVISLANTSNGAGYERCVVISYPLGIVRTGTYTNSTSTCAIDP